MDLFTNEIEYKTFKKNAGRGGERKPRTMCLHKQGRIALSGDLLEECKDKEYLKVAVNKLTGDVFIVFDCVNESCAIPLRLDRTKNNKNVVAYNKELTEVLTKKLKGNRLRLSENMSIIDGCHTYKVLGAENFTR